MVLRLKTWESRSPPGPPTTRTQSSRLILPSVQPVTCSRRMPVQHPDAGWSSPVARQAHNLKVAGSNPAPATKSARHVNDMAGFLLFMEGRAQSRVHKVSEEAVTANGCAWLFQSTPPNQRNCPADVSEQVTRCVRYRRAGITHWPLAGLCRFREDCR